MSQNKTTTFKKSATPAERVKIYLDALGNDNSEKYLSSIDQDKILEIKKGLNPYGRTIAGSDKYINFSITQITHEYWKKFITTSMIGYLNRMCDEWRVPNGVPVISVYEYLEDPSKANTPQMVIDKDNKSLMYDYEFNRQWMEKRKIVKEFLEEMFQFNPDEHVRSAYDPNFKDLKRKPLDTMAARLAMKHRSLKDDKFNNERVDYYKQENIPLKKTQKVVRSRRTGKVKTIYIDEPANPPAVPSETFKTPIKDNDMRDPNVTDTVTNMIPPHDIFGRFKMYYQENYEQLREAVLALYCEKPEFELAINPYSYHDTLEEAEAFKKQHANEVIAEVFTAHTGKWNFFDSFKEQRESVNFYNKNTIILEEMIKHLEQDEKLGQDLMAKRVEKEKRKNIIEAGPDADNFAQWKADNSELSKLGAIGDLADIETPDNAVEVDIWKLAKGGLELTKDKMYSLAEPPKQASTL